MSRLVSYARSLRATPLGRYIPGNKVLGGALAGLASAYLAKQHVIHVPPLYVSLAAFAAVSYLLPESPVAAAHTVVRKGYVKVTSRVKSDRVVEVGPLPPAQTIPGIVLPDPTAIQAGVQPPVVPPQSA